MSDEAIDQTTTTDTTTDNKKPPKYHVVLYNDDYTPMDFVVQILTDLFGYDQVTALDITMDVHEKGKGIAGTYPFDIAETKAMQIVQNARRCEHPLMADVEEAEDN